MKRLLGSKKQVEPTRHEMDVKDTRFLVDKMGGDCRPLQYLRELTENGVQAVEARGIDGLVTWCQHPESLRRWGVPKLCCIDTGSGMNPEEMRQSIGRLSSSGRIQANDQNFGVGAKISLLAANQVGAEYESWQDGKGHRAVLGRGDDGSVYYQQTESLLAESEMPSRIRSTGGYGTVVTLLGDDLKSHNTFEAPSGVDIPSGWILRELNKRYLSFPDSTKVMAPGSNGTLTSVEGQNWYATEYKSKSGKFDSAALDCTYHWAIVPPSKKRESVAWKYGGGARLATLYNNELYDFYNGNSAAAILQTKCGMSLAANRIALWIEPLGAIPTTQRSALQVANQPLLMDEYYADFSENMPGPIEKLIQEKMKDSVNTKNRIAKRLERLYRPGGMFGSKYGKVSNPKGRSKSGGELTESLFDASTLPGHTKTNNNQTSQSQNNSQPGSSDKDKPAETPPAANKNASSRLPGSGSKSSRKKKEPTQQVPQSSIWVSGKDEDMAGVFARLVAGKDLLVLNKDFGPFRDLEREWVKRAAETEAAKKHAREAVRSEYEVLLVEMIVAARMMHGSSAEWDDEWLQGVLSDQALTGAALVRYNQEGNIKREISKFSPKAAKTKPQAKANS
jgi:hypothetical protein